MVSLNSNLGETDNRALIPIGTKVETNCPKTTGVVEGYGFLGNRTVYLMALDKGEYSESRNFYVRVIVVAQDNLRKVMP